MTKYARMRQYVSPGSLCCLTKNFISRYTMGEWCIVACDYWLTNKSIVGEINHLGRYIYFIRISVNSARILLCSTLPKGRVSISQKDIQ